MAPNPNAAHLKLPSIRDCLPLAELNKELGNAAFLKGKLEEAASKYNEGVRLLEEVLLSHYACQWRVIGENPVTVFAEPSKTAATVDTLQPKETIRGQKHNEEWFQVMSPEGDAELLNAFLPFGSEDCQLEPVLSEEMREKGTKVWVALELNLAQICLKGRHWQECVEHASRVLEIDHDNCKALYRRALAASSLESIGWVQQAEHDLLRALQLEPNNKDVREALVKCKGFLKELAKTLKESEATGWSNLLLAAKEQCIVQLGELLEEGPEQANVDEVGPEHWTPLTLAAERGYSDVTELLLKARASIDLVGPKETSPLAIATQKKHVAVAMQLIEAGADVNLAIPEGNVSPLMMAVQGGDAHLVAQLVVAKAKVDEMEERGITALMFASQSGRSDIVKLLLDANANVDLKMLQGGTALMFAGQYGHGIALNLILQAGADIGAQDNDGRTALMYSVHFGQRDAVTRLLQANAMINQTDSEGNTALILSVRSQNFSLMDGLLNAKAALDLSTKDGANALRLACDAGETKAAMRLLEARASLEQESHSGHSAITLAALGGHGKLVDHLISARAVLDHRLEDGKTSLMLAAMDGFTEVVDILIKAGADLSMKDNSGANAVKLAESAGRHRVVERLREAEARQLKS